MSKLVRSASDGEDPKDTKPQGDHAHESRADSRDRRRPQSLSAEDCLSALSQLPGAVAMGMLKPAQASAMKSFYAEILRYRQKAESRGEHKSVPDADVIALLQKDPKLMAIMAPFLTDEQVDLVMGAEGGSDGQA